MFKRIMVPVDLAHVAAQRRALDIAADLAKRHGAPITYVGVTSAAPSALGHTPEEFADRLSAFAEEQGAANGITAETRAVISHDPTTDVDDALLRAVGEVGADLVVMASHVPGLAEYIWPSNGGKIAAHSGASVFVVRS